MSTQYKTHHLTREEKTAIIWHSYQIAGTWWIDELDCSKSFRRQPIGISFTDIMAIYDGSSLTVFHRNIPPENYLEVGFRQSVDKIDYFLWIIVYPKYMQEIIGGLEEWN